MNDIHPESVGRVLCVTSNLPRWAGDSTTPFVLNLAEDLQSLGWQVDLLAPHAPGAAHREALAGVNIERFQYLWPARQQSVCYQGGALINLRKRPANYLKLPALLAAEFGAIARRLITRRYDIVHSHWILPQGFLAALPARVRRVPHVITVHGGDVFGLRGAATGWAKSVALRHANAVTVNSRFTGDAVGALVPGLQSMHRIPMGVATDPLGADQAAEVSSIRRRYRRGDGPLLVFVGRIVDEKGVEDILHAVDILRDELPDLRALIVGDGQDREAMQAQAHELKLTNRVSFPGWVDPAMVRAYFAAADIFVAPSRQASDGWIEAQGLTVLEAMIAGAPVIATRLGGVTDSVIDDTTGLLVDDRAPAQIAAAIRRLVEDRVLASSLVEQGMRHAQDNFSRRSSAMAFSRLFGDLVGKGE